MTFSRLNKLMFEERLSLFATTSPAVVSVQHPIHQPTLTKAALSDFTLVMTLFEDALQTPQAQYPCGAALTEPDEFGPQIALRSVTASLGVWNWQGIF
jgi:hypothetical protein